MFKSENEPTRPERLAIWAQDRSGVIGDGSSMLWHVPADFQHFKAETLGSPVIMGRASFEALDSALPGRLNIVLTRNTDYSAPGARVAHTLDEAFEMADQEAQSTGSNKVWVTGGAQVYRASMPYMDTLVVTHLDLEVSGEATPFTLVHAPDIDPAVWQIDEQRSDSTWRARSGDSRWKVAVYRRHS